MKLGRKTCTEAKGSKPEHKPKQVKQLYSLTMHLDSELGALVARYQPHVSSIQTPNRGE